MPRALIEDDSYKGYKFEKGTVVTYNHFSISHDEKEFAENEHLSLSES
jgi:cytochrome P450